jgi:LysM repeat protein
VAFAGAPSLHTAAHEAAHVVQQRGGVQLLGGVGAAGDEHEQHANAVADAVVTGGSAEGLLDAYAPGGGGGPGAPSAGVQRYEAGEHAKAGDTQAELKKAYAPIKYTVGKDDTLESIAEKFKISVDELKAANPEKLKKLPAKAGGKKPVDGFAPGDEVAVPQKLNEMARDAVKDPSAKLTVNGVVLDYGTVIAMGGDLFASPEEMAATPPDQLKAIAELVAEEKRTGVPVSTERWQVATKGRMVDLAAKNDSHFAPSNKDVVAVSGKSTGDHKLSWEDNHRKAVGAARAGDKDKALLMNAFGDHFLTDAFSAGHLFNKRDVMEKFNSQLPTSGEGKDRELTKGSKQFFDAIAATAFVGDVATELSKYETAERMYGFHPNINSASRFSSLLQGIHMKKPELFESAVAKGVHDTLNTRPGGLPVENLRNDRWSLSGDNTLNPATLAVMQRAVAQSQQNVIASFRATSEPDTAALCKRVWDFTPRPTAESGKEVASTVASGSDANDAGLRKAIVDLIKSNYLTILAELVKLNELKKA